MADFASSDVTYSFKPKDKSNVGRLGWKAIGTLTFGDAALTIPAGGIPLLKANMGLPRVIRSLKVIESNNSGFVFEYDVSEEKLLISAEVSDGSGAALQALSDAATLAPAAMTLVVEVVGY